MIELLLEAERELGVGQYDQAERLYWQAIENDSKNSIAIVGLARVALERGDEQTALAFARKALGVDPKNIVAGRMVARLSEVLAYRGASATGASFTAGDTSGGSHAAPTEPGMSQAAPAEPRTSNPAAADDSRASTLALSDPSAIEIVRGPDQIPSDTRSERARHRRSTGRGILGRFRRSS